MTNTNSNSLNISTGHPVDCTAQPQPMREVVDMIQDHIVMMSAKVLAIRTMIACHKEYLDRCSTMNLIRGEYGSVSTTEGRDAMRVAKSLDLIRTVGKWGQFTKTVGRPAAFASGLLTMRISKPNDDNSALARAQRHCLAKHSAAVNNGPTTHEGAAFLSLFRSILTTLKAVSFNGSVCGFASREAGLLDGMVESANELLNYDLGGLDGGTCSEALHAIQEAYRQA